MDNFTWGQPLTSTPPKKLHLIFRSCANQDSGVHFNNKDRVIKDKEKLSLLSLGSVFNSVGKLTNDIRTNLVIVDDHSPDSYLDKVKILIDNNKNFDKIDLVTPPEHGNPASMKCAYSLVDDLIEQDELIFFIEDDFILKDYCLEKMIDFYIEMRGDIRKLMKAPTAEVALFPLDAPDRYLRGEEQGCSIMAHKGMYWRTVLHTTGVVMLNSDTYRKARVLFDKFSNYGIDPEIHESNTINLIWQNPEKGAVLFSPIPTLAYSVGTWNHFPLFNEQERDFHYHKKRTKAFLEENGIIIEKPVMELADKLLKDVEVD